MSAPTQMRTDRHGVEPRVRAAASGRVWSAMPMPTTTAAYPYQGLCGFALLGHTVGIKNTGRPRRRRM